MDYTLNKYEDGGQIPSYTERYPLPPYVVIHVVHLRIDKIEKDDQITLGHENFLVRKVIEKRALKSSNTSKEIKNQLYFSRLLLKSI